MTQFTADRIALNPIQWAATSDGWLDPSLAPEPAELLRAVHDAGFRSIMCAPPPGWSPSEYQEAVLRAELTLAPGYAVYRGTGISPVTAEEVDTFRTVARVHAQLGLDRIGIGMGMAKDGLRIAHPAVGYAADPERLAQLTEDLSQIAQAMVEEGVRPNLHPHIGTWIETEDETRTVLDSLPETWMGFLPDIGHLTWAGADLASLLADYGTRVGFVHIKDMRLAVADRGREEGWGYQETVRNGIWIEPGRGDLDISQLIGILPDSYDGHLMVEVDKPDMADPYTSAQWSAAWMHKSFCGE